MGDLVTFSNDTSTDLTQLGQAVQRVAPSGSADHLLRLLRDGSWVFGPDNIEPEEGSEWAINPYSFKHGYIAWADSKVFGEVMVPITSPLPTTAELNDAPEGWQEQIGFQLQCISGEDKGQQVAFKATSLGGKRAAQALAMAIASQASTDADNVVPVVELNVDHYTHKKYGKIYTPMFDIGRWTPISGEAEAPKGRSRSK